MEFPYPPENIQLSVEELSPIALVSFSKSSATCQETWASRSEQAFQAATLSHLTSTIRTGSYYTRWRRLKTLMILNQNYVNSFVRHIISLNTEPNHNGLSQAHDRRASTPWNQPYSPPI